MASSRCWGMPDQRVIRTGTVSRTTSPTWSRSVPSTCTSSGSATRPASADGGLGEGLARFDGPAGELPGTAPVSAEQDAVRAVHDHTDPEGGVRRGRGVGAGTARHAFRTASGVQPVGDRVVRRRGVDRRDRFQGEAVLDQEVLPQLHPEDPHTHGVVLGCAGQSQDLGARGHLVRGPGAVRVGVQRGEDQASARFEAVGQGGQQPVGVEVRHGADGVDQVVRVGSAQVGDGVGAHRCRPGWSG